MTSNAAHRGRDPLLQVLFLIADEIQLRQCSFLQERIPSATAL